MCLAGLLSASCGTEGIDLHPVLEHFKVGANLPIGWVELGPHSAWIARVITNDEICPSLMVDSAEVHTTLRAKPNEHFPIHVCEATISPHAKQIHLGKKELPVPKKDPQRILVIGDTGCRISKYVKKAQGCNTPESWPFPSIALEAARLKPDLVIHTGDIVYREQACPEGDHSCAGSPYGQNWKTWESDFFIPAEPLLAEAPWVVARGNHEDCPRNWEGWFKFLDPGHYTEGHCTPASEPYWVNIGDNQLVVADSSNLNGKSDPQEVHRVTTLFHQVEKISSQHSNGSDRWFLTHSPIWAFEDEESGSQPGEPKLTALHAAADKTFLNEFQLALAGHVHTFLGLSFDDPYTSQFIVGNGGTSLTPLPDKITASDFGDRKIKNSTIWNDFGFMMLEKHGDRWNGKVYDRRGQVVISCKIHKSQIDCAKVTEN